MLYSFSNLLFLHIKGGTPMYKISLIERLEDAAEIGKKSIFLFVWKKNITSLRKNGLKVTEKFPSSRKKGLFYCEISWEHAIVEDINIPFSDKSLSQAQRLWLIAEKGSK